jgi:hypothetical protein
MNFEGLQGSGRGRGLEPLTPPRGKATLTHPGAHRVFEEEIVEEKEEVVVETVENEEEMGEKDGGRLLGQSRMVV